VIDGLEASVGIYAASLIIGVLSGVIPIVNAELYLIGVVLLTGNLPAAVILGVIVAVGQMIAKIALYQAARGATNLGRNTKFGAKLEKARALVDRWQGKPITLLFLSATTGIPPFFIVSVLAGMLAIRIQTFVVVGLVGRILRFVTIALAALLV
jgi:membrane protein YqaA with SNARE-associated domain